MTELTSSSEERLANLSQRRDSGKDWMIRVASWPLSILEFLQSTDLGGLSGKTSPVFSQPTEDGILAPSSRGWGNSGIGTPIGLWTLNTSEFPSGGVESSLSDILETGGVPQQCFLSAEACAGILRRAEKRGKTLPERLRTALLQSAK